MTPTTQTARNRSGPGSDRNHVDPDAPSRRRGRAAALLAVVALAAVPLLAACGGGDEGAGSTTTAVEGFAGYSRTPSPSVAAVTLPAADGSGDVAMPAPAGGLRIVYFGYTSCPDVCPTTMSDLKRALADLPSGDRAKVSVDMVSIDPARDLPQKLVDYVRTFIPDGVALGTSDDARLRAAANAFGADYSVTPGKDGGDPEVSHTADLYVVDDAGRLVLAWPFGTKSGDIAADLRLLLAGERPEGMDATTTTSAPAPAPS